MKSKSKYGLPFSYILSYLLSFIVPFSIISLIFYFNSVNSLREETEISNINNLNNIKNIVDSRIIELSNIGALISYTPSLTPYWVNKNEYIPEAISELQKYKENSFIIEELYLYYFQHDNLLSNQGKMSIDTFIDYRTKLDQNGRESFLSSLNETEFPGFMTEIDPFGNNPTFLYPLPPGTGGTYGVVVMKLKPPFFKNMINNILGSYDGNVFIFDQNQHLIDTYSKNNTFLSSTHIKEILNQDVDILELKVDKVNYSIVKVKSEISNWSYVMAVPTKQFFGKVSELKTFMLLVLLFISIVAFIFTIYLALRNYQPIKKVVDIIQNKDASLQFTSKNDLENLGNIIESLYSKNDDLHYKYMKQEPLIRDQFLTAVLKGSTNRIDQYNEFIETLQLDFDGPHSFVVVTALSKDQLSVDMKKLELAANSLLKSAKVYSIELIDDKVMAYIINGKIKSSQEKSEFLCQLSKLLSNETYPYIGVGKTYKGIDYINRSFIEASAAFEHGKSNQKAGVIRFEEINESQETTWLPKTDLLKLTQSCKQGNKDIADEAILSLTTWIEENNAPLNLKKHMKYDMINTLIKIAFETGISVNLQNIYYQVDEVNLKQFQQTLSQLSEDICRKIIQKKEDQKNQLQQDILDYIHTHFQDYDLSLENIAKDFNLSASYLSRFIKEETSTTFSQYVWELRLNEVKKQLIETNLPIKDIISKVGYIDAPNFTRKFKNSVGITPSEFRTIHSKAN